MRWAHNAHVRNILIFLNHLFSRCIIEVLDRNTRTQLAYRATTTVQRRVNQMASNARYTFLIVNWVHGQLTTYHHWTWVVVEFVFVHAPTSRLSCLLSRFVIRYIAMVDISANQWACLLLILNLLHWKILVGASMWV